MGKTVLKVADLWVSFDTYRGDVQAVRGVSFDLNEGETLAIVGESGSGKSVLSKSLMRLVPQPGKIKKGEVWFDAKNLVTLPKRKMEKIRGSQISMILQDPMTSLNPTMSIGKQLTESLWLHHKIAGRKGKEKAVELLDRVGIPNPEMRIKLFPHQLSGGMRQRVVIAIALACNPKVLIADEPTTALDVTIQAQILDLLRDLQKRAGMSVVFITHDLGVVAHLADRVAVMYAGKMVEIGTVDEIFYSPKHPYTWGLLASMPRPGQSKDPLYSIPGSPPDLLQPPPGDAFAPRNEYALNIDFQMEPPLFPISDTHYAATWLLHERAPAIDPPDIVGKKSRERLQSRSCKKVAVKSKVPLLQVRNLKKHFKKGKQVIQAVDDISFEIYRGETLGLVGESGCGKSTVGRTLMRLYEKTSGQVLFDGDDVHGKKSEAWLGQFYRKVQMIFQDPYSSLNPRQTVADIVAEGLDIHGLSPDPDERMRKIYHLVETVGLSRDHVHRYPHEFSGGQRQRIGIARALAVEPELIIADEPISALDVSIQAQVVNLLKRLQEEKGLTYLFIAHDLSMVHYISDRIGVMYRGRLVELADSDELYRNPIHPYTQSLLSAIPLPDPATERNRKRTFFDERRYMAEAEKRAFREIDDGHWVMCTEKEYQEYVQKEALV
ncbi:ABC transporter ATP-binding protein [Desmospora profundinema]|uniref:Peptide/nickel transport system ATP-binding protein n=1 Tax=Desmospora profundinema TaxID=1571184 RepID=A0ABU1IJG2_9BACL|nr:ABC transporter ATP-binding protein [Desmospora profundinema]MDR6224907.1 peptide/nickel transport system ATP-binding protein [Desmospora profundinema]